MKKIIFIIFATITIASCQKEYVDPDQKPRPTPTSTERPETGIELHKDQ